MVVICRPKGETLYFEATYGFTPEFAEFAASHPAQIDRGSVSEHCSTVKLFISLMLEPTPNTLTAEVRKLEAIARLLESRSCEKDRRLESSPGAKLSAAIH
jgi:hypothetical protein